MLKYLCLQEGFTYVKNISAKLLEIKVIWKYLEKYSDVT